MQGPGLPGGWAKRLAVGFADSLALLGAGAGAGKLALFASLSPLTQSPRVSS